MKAGIHPEYKAAKVTCACGNIAETRSTVGNIHVEICSIATLSLPENKNWSTPPAIRKVQKKIRRKWFTEPKIRRRAEATLID